MGPSLRRALLLAGALLSLSPSTAAAQELGGFRFLVTETSIVNYHTDNRDSDLLNDNYGEWLNRLNTQATRGALTINFRLDSAIYFKKPDPNSLARTQAEAEQQAIRDRANIQGISFEEARLNFIEQQTLTFGRNLSSRYNNTLYPSKLAVSYSKNNVDLVVGDFYAQLGRGMVLALRKADELATDTTLRGAKIDYRPDLGPMKLGLTLLAGYTNPLRVDEVSGRQLAQRRDSFDAIVFPLAPGPNATFYTPDARPTFATDRIIGARIEHGVREVQISLQSAYLRRVEADFYNGNEENPARNAGDMINASVGINVPDIVQHGSFYFEGALQTLERPILTADASAETHYSQIDQLARLSGGKALYALLTLYQGPVTLNLEGKHYDRFYPLAASISRESTEFLPLQYSAPPTTEFIWSDTQFNTFNVCVTGGRARLDVKAHKSLLLYSSLGGYVSHSERADAVTCGQIPGNDDQGNTTPPPGKNDKIRNTVWDPWAGFEWNASDNRSHIYGSIGTRFDNTPEPEVYAGIDEPTTSFYREFYHARYDIVAKIKGPISLQTAGFHRYRFKAEQKSTPWFEGENYLSLLFAPRLTAAFGYEYTTVFGSHKNFFNGQILYRFTTDKTLRVFVGQSRPALRCVSGVCRQFPAFEGAKVEAVFRF